MKKINKSLFNHPNKDLIKSYSKEDQKKIYSKLNKEAQKGFSKIENVKSQFETDNSLKNLSFQIDFKNGQIIKETTLVGFLNNNSFRSQHLFEGETKIIRWWFENFGIAINVMAKIKHDLDHRLICIEKNALFIQIGDFN